MAQAENKYPPEKSGGAGTFWSLRLHVAGQTPKSLEAFANLKMICDEHLRGRCEIEVIDLQANPHLARQDQIIAIPTLIRKLPEPVRKLIGTLADTERVLLSLQIRERPGASG